MSAIRRLGKKTNPKIRNKIISYFPFHTTYLEPFWGGGGMFFNKERAKYNFLNDLDGDVYNAFVVISERRAELVNYLELVPYGTDVFGYFKRLKTTDPVKKCAKFLILSAWGYMGTPGTCKFGLENSKKNLIAEIEKTYRSLVGGENRFLNCDFRKFFKQINFKHETEKCDCKDDKETAFAYLDPPYLGTANNYDTPVWAELDVIDLMDIMQNFGMKMAMSEFDHPFVIAEAEKRGFTVIYLGERQNMKNVRQEILILNYEVTTKLF